MRAAARQATEDYLVMAARFSCDIFTDAEVFKRAMRSSAFVTALKNHHRVTLASRNTEEAGCPCSHTMLSTDLALECASAMSRKDGRPAEGWYFLQNPYTGRHLRGDPHHRLYSQHSEAHQAMTRSIVHLVRDTKHAMQTPPHTALLRKSKQWHTCTPKAAHTDKTARLLARAEIGTAPAPCGQQPRRQV